VTLSPLRVASPESSAAVLIAAASGRALAGSARRAGYEPLVADIFGDTDTCDAAAAHRIVDGLEFGFCAETLVPALEALADGEHPVGFVYGAGFEDRTALLDEIGKRWRILGNPAEVVRRVKDPIALAALCEKLGIPHPETRVSRPADPTGWLAKSIGGSGGTHVVCAGQARESDAAVYYQRIAAGDPVSVLFLGDGTDAHVIGASRQWTAPTPGEPFRYGGCLRPAELSPNLAGRLEEMARMLTSSCGLVGLSSIDLLVAGEDFTLLEINPRPGATLDIFEDDKGSLFSAHVAACRGRLPRDRFRLDGAAAAAIVYARHEIASMPRLDWPEWTADRQRPQTALYADAPLCTIKAWADEPSRARALVDARGCSILDSLDTLREGLPT
jgi:predicted ATP-grasp superfamily ATP-dependent carboligase